MSIYTLGFVLVAPSAGRLIDTYRDKKKSILIICDVARAFMVLSYIQALFYGRWPVPNTIFYLSILAVVMISGIARPSMWAFIPETTDPAELGKMNVRMSVSADIAMALGTAFGGFLLARVSFAPIFAIDSFTYLISAVMLSTLALPMGVASGGVGAPTLPHVDRAFLNEVLLSKPLRQSLLLSAVNNILVGFLNFYLVLSVEKTFRLPSSFIAYGYSFWALGGILTLFVYPLVARLAEEGLKSIYLFSVVGVVITIPAVLMKDYRLFYLLTVVLGATFSLISAQINSLSMRNCSQAMAGRFGALLNLVIRFSMLAGLWLGPILTRRANFVLWGGVLIIIFLGGSYLRSERRGAAVAVCSE